MEGVLSEVDALSKRALLTKFCHERSVFLGYMYRSVFDPQLREDIFQEACVRFLLSGAEFQCHQAAARYMYRIINSLIADHYASKDRKLTLVASPQEAVCETQSDWNDPALIGRLRFAMGMLSPKERLLIAVHLSSDLPGLQDKSRYLDLPISTYRYQLEKAIGQLRKLMKGKRRRLVPVKPTAFGRATPTG